MEPGIESRNVESMSTELRNEKRARCNEPENEWSALFFLRRMLNFLLVSFFITPLTVSYWRGTWYILDLFVFPSDQLLSYWVSCAAGFGVIYLIVLVEDYLKAFLNGRNAKTVLYVAMFYPLSSLIVSSWRGLWKLLDYYTAASLTSACVSHGIGFLIVLSMKATSSIKAVPGYCSSERNVDISVNILERITCFRIKMSHFWKGDTISNIATRMLNSFVTVFVIGSGVISYWRGTWIIVESIKPDDNLMSSIIALSLGFAIWSICYSLREVIATKKLNPPYRWWLRVLEGMFVYFLGFGVVSTWAGLWFLEDIFLFPGQCFDSLSSPSPIPPPPTSPWGNSPMQQNILISRDETTVTFKRPFTTLMVLFVQRKLA